LKGLSDEVMEVEDDKPAVASAEPGHDGQRLLEEGLSVSAPMFCWQLLMLEKGIFKLSAAAAAVEKEVG